jgi:hypothetical protein
MSGTARLALGASLFAATALTALAASAMPLRPTPGKSFRSGSIEQVRTICYYDQWGRRLCYNTSGRPIYPPGYYRRWHRPPPRYYDAPAPYYRPY